MTTTKPSYVTIVKTSSSVATTIFANTGADYQAYTVAATPVILEITVPAYTVYTVEYTTTYSNSGTYGREHGLIDGWQSGDSGDFSYDMAYLETGLPYPNMSGEFSGGDTGDHLTGYGVVFYNNTGSSQTMKANTFYLACAGQNVAGTDVYTFSVAFSNLTVKSININAPTTTDTTPVTYDGTAKTFNYSYNFPQVTDFGENFAYLTNDAIDTTLEAKDYDGNTISASTYSLNSTTENSTLTATEAGKYKVKFNIKADVVAGSVKWDNGSTSEKSFTFEIKRKTVTVPTVTDSPKTYDPAGNVFNVDSNYNPTIMTASAVSAGVTWNSGMSRFEATNVNTYAVKFALNDKKNYVWNIGSGTTADQSASVKIDPKILTVPTITAPQAYAGSALTFNLFGFDGTTMSMDGVTGANSSTVTDGSGGAPTNTTDTFKATNVGVYTLTISLRDTTNYAWSDGVTAAKTVQFEITQKELLSAPPVSDKVNIISNAEWKYGDSATITITDDRATGDTLNLLVYYDSPSNVLFTGTTTSSVNTITMPTTIAVGTHTLTVELNGTSDENPNYKVTANNTLSFEVTAGALDPSTYGWIYTKEGSAGGPIADNGKLPFELKPGSSTDGVKYEVFIQIPSSDSAKVAIDTSKYILGYQTQSGSTVNTYVTTVALKSIDSTFTLTNTDIVLNWEIEKGTFDLTGVKWEYSTDNSTWTEYNPTNPPQYNDGNYVTVRVKANTLPLGLTLDSLYTGMKKTEVDTYTATVSASDLVYNTTNFNAPNTSAMALSWEIAKKNLYNGFKNVKDTYSNSNGSGSYILKQLNVPTGFEGYINYLYYEDDGTPTTLAAIKAAIDPTDEKQYKVEAYIDPAYAAKYTVDDNGSVPYDNFITGSNNVLATATIGGNDGSTPITAVYDGNGHFEPSVIVVTGDNAMNVTDFTVTYYTGTIPTAGNELPAGEVPKNAGDYCILITLGSVAEDVYILATDTFTVKIEPTGIELPTLGEMTFNGNELKFEDYLGGSWNDYKDKIELDGKLADRNVGAGDYVTTLRLTDGNYKWIYPASAPATAAYKLTADGVSVTGDDVTATYNWNIKPLIVDTTNMWNKGSKGATLNLPNNIKDLIAGGTLELGYRYYDGEGNYVESPEIKGGRSFKVEAVFGGDDSLRNVQFKRSATELSSTSASVDYTVPQSGAAVFFGNALSFLKRNWLWLLIALSILLFLIILICIIAHRRKTKEAREEKKAQKEEEKRRREEEREERRRKQEAELELQKAKQEAELAKMKAGLGVGMGAAGMAMAAQPVQQQMPIQQPQYQPQPQYSVNELAELKADIRELKAQQRAGGYPQMPMMQMPMMQMPMSMPMQGYGPQMGGGMGGGTSEVLITMLQNQLNEMRSGNADKEIAALRTQMELMKLQPQPQIAAPAKQEIPANTDNGEIEKFGAFAASLWRNMNSAPAPKEVAQAAEESKPVSVSYPPDAVVTTTTTVDTTKSKPEAPRSDDGRVFDLDGFYDTFDNNK